MNNSQVITHNTIFPRPTPWKVAWSAFAEFLRGRQTYQFAYIPARFMRLMRYDIMAECDDLVLLDCGQEVLRTPILPMDWYIWILYVVESYVTGLFWAVWNWRLNADDIDSNLTRAELCDKIARLDAMLEQQHKSSDEEASVE